ncbi:MAG: glycosyltransferase family 4 protein [Hyphomicrobiales bacterium]|nr:glycosyltransferase family 4 protein [Hyphomicrobiales bacterium]
MPIRTAFLTNFVPPYRLRLLTALQARLGELKIFTSTTMEPDRPWTPNYGKLEVIVQKCWTFKRHRKHPNGCDQRLFIHFPYDTLFQLRRFAPEVVLSSELGLRTLQAAIYRLFMPKSRLIVWATLSEETEKGWGVFRQLLRKFILSVADGVICNGSSGARYISSFGVPIDRIFVVNQPVDVELFAGLPAVRAEPAARRLLFSGRLIPIKAVLELQAACVRWSAANPTQTLELIWLGDGELRGQLEATQVPPNFKQTFCGTKQYDELREIYGSAGALVLPSLLDEWGLVVNEAMTSGVIVLGSIYSQAAVEMVSDGLTGWLVDPLRPETIERALDRLFETPLATLDAMRSAARERGMMITPERAAEAIASALEVVVSGNARVERPGAALKGPAALNKRSVIEPVTTTKSLA